MNQSMKYGISNIERVSRILYFWGIAMGFMAGVIYILNRVLNLRLENLLPSCYFFTATGYYCPGCGGTRSVCALLDGNIGMSIHYHIAVIYMLVYYILFELSHTISILTKGKVKGLLFCPYYFYIGIALIIIQCLVKNYMKYRYGCLL